MGEWKELTLGDVSIDGGHYGIAASAVPLDASLPTYLRITDIRDDGTINKSGLTSVDDPNSVEYILSPNDLVIARTGASTGRNYFYDGRDGELVYAGFLIKFSIDPNKIYPQYVKYWFLSPFYKAWLNSHTDGSTRANINAVTLADCPIRFPADLPTQRCIAAVLGALDDKIEVNRKICENLEAQAQALFKAWFVDFEPFGGKRPEGWKNYRLGDFFPVRTGKKDVNCTVNEGEYPFFSCAQDTLRTNDYSFDGNAVLVAGNGDFNVKWYNGKFEAYQRTYVLLPRDPRLTCWLFYVIKHNLRHITQSAQGSVIKFITKGHLENFEFSAPMDLESCKLIQKFQSIREFIALKERESRALAAMRDALLPKLMSGELAVEKVEG